VTFEFINFNLSLLLVSYALLLTDKNCFPNMSKNFGYY